MLGNFPHIILFFSLRACPVLRALAVIIIYKWNVNLLNICLLEINMIYQMSSSHIPLGITLIMNIRMSHLSLTFELGSIFLCQNFQTFRSLLIIRLSLILRLSLIIRLSLITASRVMIGVSNLSLAAFFFVKTFRSLLMIRLSLLIRLSLIIHIIHTTLSPIYPEKEIGSIETWMFANPDRNWSLHKTNCSPWS